MTDNSQDPELLRGLRVRALRTAADVSIKKAAEAMGLPEKVAALCEDHDLVYPGIHAEQLRSAGVSVGHLRSGRLPPGRCLNLWRRCDPVDLAKALHTMGEAVDLVEILNWPVPPEWMPPLVKLGFSAWMPGDETRIPKTLSVQDPRRREEAIRRMRAGGDLRAAARAADVCEQTAAKWRAAAGITPVLPEVLRLRAQVLGILNKSGGRTLLRGHWLRERRTEKNIGIGDLARDLGMQAKSMESVEKYDLVLPAEWLPTLRQAGLLERLDAGIPPTLTGTVVGKFCADRDIWLENLAYLLNTKTNLLQIVMSRDMPVCPEWLPALATLGLRTPEPAAAHQSAAAAAPAPPPGPAQEQAEMLRGSWLRELRGTGTWSAARLANLLNIPRSDLYRVEGYDLLLPQRFLAPLRKHGLLPQKVQTPPEGGGRDLYRKMREAGISIDTFADRAGIPRSVVEMVASRDWPVPAAWDKGFEVPPPAPGSEAPSGAGLPAPACGEVQGAAEPEPDPAPAPEPQPEPEPVPAPDPRTQAEREADSWAAIAYSYRDNCFSFAVALKLLAPNAKRSLAIRIDCPFCRQPGFLLYNSGRNAISGACMGRCRGASRGRLDERSKLKLYDAGQIIEKVTGSSWHPPGEKLSPPAAPPEEIDIEDQSPASAPAPAPAETTSRPVPPPLPRGRWLADLRACAGIPAAKFMRLVKIFGSDLDVMEQYDLVVPSAWIDVLEKEGICAAAQQGPALMLGSWLARVRLHRNLSYETLSERVGVPMVVIAKVENRNWPIPPEWHPAIQRPRAHPPAPAEQAPKPPAPVSAPAPAEPAPEKNSPPAPARRVKPVPPAPGVAVTLPLDMVRDLSWLFPGQSCEAILLSLARRFIRENQPVLERLMENQRLMEATPRSAEAQQAVAAGRDPR